MSEANEAIPLEPRNKVRTIIRYPLGGCGNIKYDASMKQNHVKWTWTVGREHNIAATPQGGSDFINPPSCYEGKRLASLTSSPRYDTGTPQGGSNHTITYIQFVATIVPWL